MHQFRLKLIKLSVVYAGAIGVFCLIAPIFGYPLHFPNESIAVMQQVLPIFIGFLAAGARFFVGAQAEEKQTVSIERLQALNTILNWAFGLFTILTVSLFMAFGFSGSRWAESGQGMSLDQLTLLMAILLSIVTGSVGVIVAFSFDQKITPSATENHSAKT